MYELAQFPIDMYVCFCLCYGQVRREKISERMKFLQDLVPGCNKVLKREKKKLHYF